MRSAWCSALLASACVALAPLAASADTIGWGVPVAAAGSTTQVGLPLVSHDATPDGISNPTPDWIKYYIPLSSSTSGTYGVTDTNGPNPCEPGDCAGTFVDSGSGNSYLNMYLMFSEIAPLPLDSARAAFEFSDLDLKYVNDPSGFFESVQLFSYDGSALSPKFTAAPGAEGSGSFNGINWELSRTAGSAGANWPVYLDLWGDGLTSLVQDPFWVKLKFTVPSIQYGTNTAEYLRASLTTQTASVPEPASLSLLAGGLAMLGVARRRG